MWMIQVEIHNRASCHLSERAVCGNYGLQPELRFEGANWLIHHNITKLLI